LITNIHLEKNAIKKEAYFMDDIVVLTITDNRYSLVYGEKEMNHE
jgi:hypothetical protein